MNGCTWFPRMRLKVEECCNQHDEAYGHHTTLTRKQADRQLYACVKKHNRFFAIVMYIGVRLFGHKYYRGTQR